MFHCHLSKMLRNINWHSAETLLETPGSFELMAYLDGNPTAIGKKSAKNLNKNELDTKLYNAMDEFKEEVVPQITCIAEELQILKAEMSGLKEELGTKANKSDLESLEKNMDTKLSLKADKSDMEKKANKSDMEHWKYNLNLLANSMEAKLQGKADREELDLAVKGKVDREELDLAVKGKADREELDRKFARCKRKEATGHPWNKLGQESGRSSLLLSSYLLVRLNC